MPITYTWRGGLRVAHNVYMAPEGSVLISGDGNITVHIHGMFFGGERSWSIQGIDPHIPWAVTVWLLVKEPTIRGVPPY